MPVSPGNWRPINSITGEFTNSKGNLHVLSPRILAAIGADFARSAGTGVLVAVGLPAAVIAGLLWARPLVEPGADPGKFLPEIFTDVEQGDVTLIIPRPQAGPGRCPATDLRKLTPGEVAALPSKQKP